MFAFLTCLFMLIAQDLPAAYDSAWGGPQTGANGLEQVMLSQDKLYVVLAVVLIIWAGILFFLYRNDRRIRALEAREQAADAEPVNGGLP